MRRPPRSSRPHRRFGLTLLEVVLAGTLTVAVVSALHVVLRGAHEAAASLHGEDDVLRQADAALRLMTRRCREAEGVLSVGPTADEGFRLDVGGGEIVMFTRGGGGNELRLIDTRFADGLTRTVAENVTGLDTVIYEADGATVTTDPAAAGMIEITLTVDLPRDHAPARTVSGRVWVRRW